MLAGRIQHASCGINISTESDAIKSGEPNTVLQSNNSVISSKSTCWSFKQGSEYSGSGRILFNGKIPPSDFIRKSVGYVPQFDYHLPLLTVQETLHFHASLKLASEISAVHKANKVNGLILTLGLRACAQTRVGDSEMKGLSGGEKRRLSIGVQLLSDPAICLFDEPTSGLDAFTARHVIETLQQLARKGRTVIMSIHQPRYDVFRMIDHIVLLARGGKQIWNGSVPEMLRHFERCGYTCPALVNPADFILDITSIDYRSPDIERTSFARLELLSNAFQNQISAAGAKQNFTETGSSMDTVTDDQPVSLTPQVTMDSAKSASSIASIFSFLKGIVTLTESNDYEKTFLFTFPLLVNRSMTNLWRQPVLCFTRITQGLFFGLILSMFFAPIGNNQKSIQNRIGNLYQISAVCFIGMLNCIAQYPIERNVFYREYADGSYSATSFFLTYFAIAIPFIVLTSVLFALLMACAVGLDCSVEGVYTFSGVVFCFLFLGECFGVMFCAIFSHIGFSVNIMSMWISLFGVSIGFLALDMPAFYVYFGDLAPLKWGSIIITNAAFKGEIFTCSDSEKNGSGSCPYSTGEEVLELYGMNYKSGHFSDRNFYVLVLFFMTLAYFIITFAVFRMKAYMLSH